MDLFLFDWCDEAFESAFDLVGSSALKGLSMFMMFVGIEGVHRERPLAGGGGLESTPSIANVFARQQRSASTVRGTSERAGDQAIYPQSGTCRQEGAERVALVSVWLVLPAFPARESPLRVASTA